MNVWLHGEFLEMDKGKMSKSAGGFLHLDQLVADGFAPLNWHEAAVPIVGTSFRSWGLSHRTTLTSHACS